ncbi:YaaA family protein [Campylobacter cuniculorum]|uniref:Peroxide stress protein YaaA n=2 Tax=Campylobacter cuniculorum TaxID=374106 RepID=A0A1W6BW99_9BACT|nr:peroxide stress protein YaaA [Campylobacter cuniculorum]ARJ56362.1 hypothetical protein (DUF328 domain) [Campylobacter cuniculorum DSM 23162 = LMG 24588]QOR03850.1 peroxide stress protein YaaA [Campylobacter cuniculorum]
MKILFSPSENKNEFCPYPVINQDSFIFKDLFQLRIHALSCYENFVKSSDDESLKDFFGVKNTKEFSKFKQDLKLSPTNRAIELYSGVSYQFLDFKSLDKTSKDYILENTLIFSNLFGVVRASDTLPFYKFKQGAKIENFAIEKFYKDNFSSKLDEFLKDENIIDLRAGFYDKFYIPKKRFTTYKFIKNGKIVSHFAKAYRGILLRILAQNQIKDNQNLLDKLPDKLHLKEIRILGPKEEIILEILE